MATEYKVLKVTELTRITNRKGIELYYQHQIETKGGIVLTVDIDQKYFTPEKVAPILKEKALNADKILAL